MNQYEGKKSQKVSSTTFYRANYFAPNQRKIESICLLLNLIIAGGSQLGTGEENYRLRAFSYCQHLLPKVYGGGVKQLHSPLLLVAEIFIGKRMKRGRGLLTTSRFPGEKVISSVAADTKLKHISLVVDVCANVEEMGARGDSCRSTHEVGVSTRTDEKARTQTATMIIDSMGDSGQVFISQRDKTRHIRLKGTVRKNQQLKQQNNKLDGLQSAASSQSMRSTSPSICISSIHNSIEKNSNNDYMASLSSTLPLKSLPFTATNHLVIPRETSVSLMSIEGHVANSERNQILQEHLILDATAASTLGTPGNARIKTDFRSRFLVDESISLPTRADSNILPCYAEHVNTSCGCHVQSSPNNKVDFLTRKPSMSPANLEPRGPLNQSGSPVIDVFHSPTSRPGDRVEEVLSSKRHSPYPRRPPSVKLPSSPSSEQSSHEETSHLSPLSVSPDAISDTPRVDRDSSSHPDPQEDTLLSAPANRKISQSPEHPRTTPPALDLYHQDQPTSVSPVSSPSPVLTSLSVAPQRTPSKTTPFSVADILDPAKFTGSKPHPWTHWRPPQISSVLGGQGFPSGLDKSPGIINDEHGENNCCPPLWFPKWLHIKRHFEC